MIQACAVAAVVLCVPLHAQGPAASAMSTRETAVADSVGSLIPSFDIVPLTCLALPERVTLEEAWRVEDTLSTPALGNGLMQSSPQNPLIPLWTSAARAQFRTCAAREWGTSLRGLHLLDAARLQLELGHDSVADVLTQRYLGDVGTGTPTHRFIADRDWAQLLVLIDRATVAPARWSAIDRIMAELDRRPGVSMTVRFAAHSWAAVAAEAEHDDARILRETDAIYGLWRANRAEVEGRFPVSDIVMLRVNVLQRQRGFAVAKAAIDSAARALASTGHADYFLQQLQQVYAKFLGKPAPKLQGTWWFHAADSGRVTRPMPGTVTIVYKPPRSFWRDQVKDLSVLRSLMKKYGSRGVEMVTLDETAGAFLDSVYADPRAEADRRRRYYLDTWQLPGMLAVWEVKDWRQLPDGRWRSKPSPRDTDYPFALTVIDKHGTVVYGQSQLSRVSEGYLDTLIGQLLEQP